MSIVFGKILTFIKFYHVGDIVWLFFLFMVFDGSSRFVNVSSISRSFVSGVRTLTPRGELIPRVPIVIFLSWQIRNIDFFRPYLSFRVELLIFLTSVRRIYLMWWSRCWVNVSVSRIIIWYVICWCEWWTHRRPMIWNPVTSIPNHRLHRGSVVRGFAGSVIIIYHRHRLTIPKNTINIIPAIWVFFLLCCSYILRSIWWFIVLIVVEIKYFDTLFWYIILFISYMIVFSLFPRKNILLLYFYLFVRVVIRADTILPYVPILLNLIFFIDKEL